MLKVFRNYRDEHNLPKEIYDDYALLRFLRARKFVWDDTKIMFENYMTWRTEQKVDTIIEDFEFKEDELVQKYYPHKYHKIDKHGRPIYIERQGQINVNELFAITNDDNLMKHYI
mmetsp:Transcript_22853/g.17312  ORF Transcript_22853/g.17312 Transcript_22853/m.17312 type:complete len:115 (+) Transcript_22853:82-426(+)|eukprot:CAMPEP_0202957646 /NCGR_PEP_ID=MMETSP1396-20130829/2035_1 /ASSEMBLY_ACC=CAM_ASM_000872 /TAXON_ID= /ORGANISM="Pseudokeronopsis sp., Strain Brazil" /LENGTH=114 /DNA_ID=CAMNT_0049675255 /DNA_START=82 /DNA_END=426 /DNA_ORIENTATION=+